MTPRFFRLRWGSPEEMSKDLNSKIEAIVNEVYQKLPGHTVRPRIAGMSMDNDEVLVLVEFT